MGESGYAVTVQRVAFPFSLQYYGNVSPFSVLRLI
jgi:hypothetical protein